MRLQSILAIGFFISLTIGITLIKSNLFSQSKNTKLLVQEILKKADIRINGDRPWDITVYNENLYDQVLTQGSLGLGETYVNGWWDCKALDQFFHRILAAHLDEHVWTSKWSFIVAYLKAKLFNAQSKDRAFEVGQHHYDLGNDLFEHMLDKSMIYSCAYWKNAQSLEEAQQHKCELICKKLGLKPGMHVLDIGCGWGSLARYMAEKYGVSVVGITISKEQAAYARKHTKNLPIQILLQDYRDTQGLFDRIVSVGMFEHVGHKNYSEFMQTANRLLKNDGLFLLHTIGSNTTNTFPDAWIVKYIFPNGILPSIAQISQASEGLFIMEDWHNFGADYDKTLMAWFERFEKNWPELQAKYKDRFYRIWSYYIRSCAGTFRARTTQLWQIVFSKSGITGGYTSVR